MLIMLNVPHKCCSNDTRRQTDDRDGARERVREGEGERDGWRDGVSSKPESVWACGRQQQRIADATAKMKLKLRRL